MKTLVIEDSTSSLKLLCSYIEKIGISTIPAENGATGIDLFLSEHPDLILLDIILPDLDGYEVARQIRLLEPPGEWTPIIFLSSMNKDKDIEMGIAAGGDDYLLKPISEVVLAAKIRAMQRIIQMRQSLLVLTRKLDSANQELKRLTSLDGLTGIPNRRHFDEVLAREWRRAMRQGEELSILMCDIDFSRTSMTPLATRRVTNVCVKLPTLWLTHWIVAATSSPATAERSSLPFCREQLLRAPRLLLRKCDSQSAN